MCVIISDDNDGMFASTIDIRRPDSDDDGAGDDDDGADDDDDDRSRSTYDRIILSLLLSLLAA